MDRPNSSAGARKTGKKRPDDLGNQQSSSANPHHPTFIPPTQPNTQLYNQLAAQALSFAQQFPMPPAAFNQSVNPALMNLMAIHNAQYGLGGNLGNQPSTSAALQMGQYGLGGNLGNQPSTSAALQPNSNNNVAQNMFMTGLLTGQFNQGMIQKSQPTLQSTGSHAAVQSNINVVPQSRHQPFPPTVAAQVLAAPSNHNFGGLQQNFRLDDSSLIKMAISNRQNDLPPLSSFIEVASQGPPEKALLSSAKKIEDPVQVEYPTHKSQLQIPSVPNEFEEDKCNKQYFAKFVENSYQLEDVYLNDRSPPWKQISRPPLHQHLEEQARMQKSTPSLQYTDEDYQKERQWGAEMRKYYLCTMVHWITAPESIHPRPTDQERRQALNEFSQYTHDEMRKTMEYVYIHLTVEQGCLFLGFIEQLISFQLQTCTVAPEWPFCFRDESIRHRGGVLRRHFTPAVWPLILQWWELQLNHNRCLKEPMDVALFDLAVAFPEADRESAQARKELIALKWETANNEYLMQKHHWKTIMQIQREAGVEHPFDPRQEIIFFSHFQIHAPLNFELLSPLRKMKPTCTWIGRDYTALYEQLARLHCKNELIRQMPNHVEIEMIPLDELCPPPVLPRSIPVITISDAHSYSTQHLQSVDAQGETKHPESHPTDPSSSISSTSITPILQSLISSTSSSSHPDQTSISSAPVPSSTSSSSFSIHPSTLPTTNLSCIIGDHAQQVSPRELEDSKAASPTSSGDLPSPTDGGGIADLSSTTPTHHSSQLSPPDSRTTKLTDSSVIQHPIEKNEQLAQTDSPLPSPSFPSSQPAGDATPSSFARIDSRMTAKEILAAMTRDQMREVRDLLVKMATDDLSVSASSGDKVGTSSHQSAGSRTAQGLRERRSQSIPTPSSSLLPTRPPLKMKIRKANGLQSCRLLTSPPSNSTSSSPTQSPPPQCSSSALIPSPTSVICLAPSNLSSTTTEAPSSSLTPSISTPSLSATRRASLNSSEKCPTCLSELFQVSDDEEEDEPALKIARRDPWHLPFLVLPAHIILNEEEKAIAKEVTKRFWRTQKVEDRAWLRMRTLQQSTALSQSSTIESALPTVPTQFVNAFENFKSNLENEKERRVINLFNLTVYSQLFSR